MQLFSDVVIILHFNLIRKRITTSLPLLPDTSGQKKKNSSRPKIIHIILKVKRLLDGMIKQEKLNTATPNKSSLFLV